MIQINFNGAEMNDSIPAPIRLIGQFRAQIDNGFHEIWQIQSMIPMPEDQLIQICQQTFIKKAVPDSHTWHEEIKNGNTHYNDWCYYNDGFYKFENKQHGFYEFTYVIPDLKPEAWQSDENRHQE